MKIRKYCLFFSLWLAIGPALAKEQVKLYSPSKEILLQVDYSDGKLAYEVFFQKERIVLPSQLLWEVDGVQLGNRARSVDTSKSRVMRSSYPFWGYHAQAKNLYREVTMDICEDTGEKYQIELRAYNTGIAFRYKVAKENRVVVDDHTGFCLPTGATCWLQPNARYYEADYTKYQVGNLPEKVIAGPPVTVKYSSGVYACITEGGLVDFGGMGLKVMTPDSFQSKPEGETKLRGAIATPWRVVMVGDLNSLVNNDIVSDVSEPLSPVFLGNTDWIQPGSCVWSWLAGYGVTFENMKRFTDWGAELGIPYNLVDEGWSHWEDKERGKDAWELVKELVDYSREKGVKILLWKAYPDRKGIEGIQTPERRQRFFAKCKELGVSGLKIDFFDCESQVVTRFYEDALIDAAKYGLVINFHGSNKPTGLSRTYPNELCREGIKGLEFGSSVAAQDVVTPYTRFVAGHADYTPMAFEEERMGNTTEAHQIAMTAIFLSPLRCYGGRPEDYVKHPAREIFLSIPVVWDETIVLPPSEIGDCVVTAHRKGTEWYIAAITDQEKKDICLPLSFLGKGTYQGQLITDDRSDIEAKKCRVSPITCTKKETLTIDMQAGGGFLAHLQLLD